jgi:hypothetical protein
MEFLIDEGPNFWSRQARREKPCSFSVVHLKITMGAPVRRGVGLLMSHLGRSVFQGAPVQ